MKISSPLSHNLTYLKWSKEKVKLPRFNVDRQTADKQCSYLQTGKMFVTWWKFGPFHVFERPRGQKTLKGSAPAVITAPELQMDLENFNKQETTSFLKKSPWDKRLSAEHQECVTGSRFWRVHPSRHCSKCKRALPVLPWLALKSNVKNIHLIKKSHGKNNLNKCTIASGQILRRQQQKCIHAVSETTVPLHHQQGNQSL